MAMYSFRDCLASEVKTQEIIPGSFLVCRDSGDMHYDNLEGERIILGKTVHVVEGKLDTEMFPEEGHFYYSATDKLVCIYHNGKMEPINLSILQYIRSGVVVDADGGTTTINVSDSRQFKGMADGSTTAKTIGEIVALVPVGCTTALSIRDLESEFTGKVSVATNVADGGATITVTNTHETMQWIGNVSAVVYLVPQYI